MPPIIYSGTSQARRVALVQVLHLTSDIFMHKNAFVAN